MTDHFGDEHFQTIDCNGSLAARLKTTKRRHRQKPGAYAEFSMGGVNPAPGQRRQIRNVKPPIPTPWLWGY